MLGRLLGRSLGAPAVAACAPTTHTRGGLRALASLSNGAGSTPSSDALRFLRRQGLSDGEARGLLATAPQVLRGGLAAAQAKLRYCEDVLGIGPREVLLHHRGYMVEGLAKLDHRVHFMAQRGQLEGQLDKTGWMVESPLAFCARLGSSMDEYEAFVRSWSMRAAAMAGAAGRAQLC